MSDIFLSYAREDRDRVKPLAGAFEEQGWDLFWDRKIPTGSTWRRVIGKELEAARCVVVVWSEHSVHSNWVHEEAGFGMQRQILAPVLIDAVTPPFGFGSVQAADLSAWDGDPADPAFAQLLADIKGMSGLEIFASNGAPDPAQEQDAQSQAPEYGAISADLAGSGRHAGSPVLSDAWKTFVREHAVNLPSLDEMADPDKNKRAIARDAALRTILNHPALSAEEKKQYVLVLLQFFKDTSLIEQAQELADAQTLRATETSKKRSD